MAFFAKGKIFAAAIAAVFAGDGGAEAAASAARPAPASKHGRRIRQQGEGRRRQGQGSRRPGRREIRHGDIKVDRAIHKAFSGTVEAFMAPRRRRDHLQGPIAEEVERGAVQQDRARYGVPPGVLLAIWGMETGFGASMGNQNGSAIATLAYDCRRPEFFTRMPSRR